MQFFVYNLIAGNLSRTSRATSMSNLQLLGPLNLRHFTSHSDARCRIAKEYRRLRTTLLTSSEQELIRPFIDEEPPEL